ncbi:MAG: hypothetical protein ABEJ89_02005 [Haloarculaceae archaeon]
MPKIEFGDGLTVTDEGDGTVTVGLDAEPALMVLAFSISDKKANDSFTQPITVVEAADVAPETVVVTLSVESPDGSTAYEATINPDSFQNAEKTVTSGVDDGTATLGPFAAATDDYTATATVDASNATAATRTATFHVDPGPHSSAPTDLQSVLDGMARDDDGTYVITTDHELQAMAADPSADYRLGNDIDASLTGQWNGGSGFDPVGRSNDFDGSFDGSGYTISGLTIDRPGTGSVGLFATSRGDLTDVTLESVDVSRGVSTGGLVGFDYGAVTRSSATGTVSGSSDVGGLVGSNEDTVDSSYWDTTASGQSSSDGGTGLTTSEMQGTEAKNNMSGLDFLAIWATVDASDADVAADDYPVLRALDRATQLEARA